MRLSDRILVWRRHPRAGLLLRWSLALAVLGGLLSWVDTESLGALLADTCWGLAAPAIIGLSLIHLAGVFTWTMISDRLGGSRPPWRRMARIYYAAQAVGTLTPANVGADVYRAWAVSGQGNATARAMVPVAAHRITSYMGLLLLGAVAAMVIPFDTVAPALLAVSAGLFVLLTVLLWWAARHAADRDSVAGKLAHRLRIPTDWASIPAGRVTGALGSGLVMSLIFHAGSIGLCYLLVSAVGGQAPAPSLLAALTLARLAILLPVPVGGVGFQEGAMTFLFAGLGLGAEMGLAVALLNRIAFLGTTAVGVVMLMTGKARAGAEPAEVRGRLAASQNCIPTL